jgi:glycosyltransferase involved in cell wall biosynthesis
VTPGDAATGSSGPELRVLYASGVGGGARRCRVFQPMEQLALAGIPASYRPSGDPGLYLDVLDHDVFIFHRVPYTPYLGDILDLIRLRGGLSIYETDDLVFRPDMIALDSYYRHLAPEFRAEHEAHVQEQRQTLERCDYTLTTTEFLADLLAAEGKPVLIHRNALAADWIAWSAQAGREVAPEPGRVTLGYVSGSKTHDYDFAEAAGALAEVMRRHPEVRLRTVGPLSVPEVLAPLADRIDTVDAVPWERVPWELARLDVNLAPLEQANPYCNAKSELKWIEASALGLVTVASRTQCFEHAVRPGETGFLAGDPAEWAAVLERLVTAPALRRDVGAAARADVLERYRPEVRSAELVAALRGLRTAHRAPAPAADDMTVAREAIRRLGDHLANDELWIQYDPDVLTRGVMRRRDRARFLRRRMEEAIRRHQRAPAARLAARGKHLANRLARRRYRTRVDGRAVEVLPPMLAGQAFSQAVTAEADGLCAVDLLLSTFGTVATSKLEVVLWAEDGSERPVARHTVKGRDVLDTHFHTVALDRLPDSAGRRFRLELSSPDGAWGDALALWRTVEVPAEGAQPLYVDGRPLPGTLAFRLRYCAS